MKNTKEFVLKIYPNAYSKKLQHYPYGWGITDNDSCISSYEYETTPTIAWKNAVDIINKEMIQKFES